MEQQKKNKEFIIRYFNAFSGLTKTRELCQQFMTDEELMEHILFFDRVFPKYEIFADEIIAEGNKVVVRARAKGRHEGEFNGIPPTYRNIDFPGVVCYEIENDKIVHHWMIADQTVMMEQLGLVGVPQE